MNAVSNRVKSFEGSVDRRYRCTQIAHLLIYPCFLQIWEMTRKVLASKLLPAFHPPLCLIFPFWKDISVHGYGSVGGFEMVPIPNHLCVDEDLQVGVFASSFCHRGRVPSEMPCVRFLSTCLFTETKISRSPLFSKTLTMLFFFFLYII